LVNLIKFTFEYILSKIKDAEILMDIRISASLKRIFIEYLLKK